LGLPDASRHVVEDLLGPIDSLKEPIDTLDQQLLAHTRGDLRVTALTRLPGVGTLTALIVVAEAGDVTRFWRAWR
jgi:transposase